MDLVTIIGIISGLITITGTVYGVYKWFKSRRKQSKESEKKVDKLKDTTEAIEQKIEILDDLPQAEQKILQIFIKNKALTCLLDVLPNKSDRWTIASLEEKGIIYKTPNERQRLFQRPYTLHHWAYKYLLNHPECLYYQ